MNTVFIAQSLDGYIADKEGKIDYLQAIPNPENDDMGYAELIARTDAIVMGRNTYETVLAFDIPWPYAKPVFVLSKTLKKIPKSLNDKVEIVKGDLPKIIEDLKAKGYKNLYIDGGKTIQSFLKEDLIDEMIITTIPVLLGSGVPLFRDLPQQMMFGQSTSKVYLNAIVQSTFKRTR